MTRMQAARIVGPNGFQQQAVQIRAMNLQRRHTVLSQYLLVPDYPFDCACGVVTQMVYRRATGRGLQRFVYAEIVQCTTRVRCYDQAGADLPYLLCPFVDNDRKPTPLQRQCRGQASDSRADDNDLLNGHGHPCAVMISAKTNMVENRPLCAQRSVCVQAASNARCEWL